MDKKELRKKCKELRKTLDITETSKKITDLIIKTDIFSNSKHIMIYYPLKDEINLLPLLDFNKNFYLPKINNDNLDICPFKKNDILKRGKFNILEPISNIVNPLILDLIIFPALAFDKQNNRLGYGGGYYDRFINKYFYHSKTKPVFMGVINEELIFDYIPTEKHDNKMDFVISCK